MEILSLGEKLKRRRKDLNMTLKDLAGERITPGQISLVESGKSNPSMDLQQFSKKGDIDNAIRYSNKTLNVFKDVTDQYYISSIENSMGKLFCEFNNMEESFMHYNKAKELRSNNNDPQLIETLISICENYIKMKDIVNTKLTLEEIIKSSKDDSDQVVIKCYLLEYRVSLLEGNNNEAEKTILMALNFVKNMDYKRDTAEISIMIGKFYIDNGRDAEASKYLDYGVDMFREIGMLQCI